MEYMCMRILYIVCVCISTINLGICANCAGHCVAGSLAVSVPMIMCIFTCYLLFIVNSLVFLSSPLLPSAAWLAVPANSHQSQGRQPAHVLRWACRRLRRTWRAACNLDSEACAAAKKHQETASLCRKQSLTCAG